MKNVNPFNVLKTFVKQAMQQKLLSQKEEHPQVSFLKKIKYSCLANPYRNSPQDVTQCISRRFRAFRSFDKRRGSIQIMSRVEYTKRATKDSHVKDIEINNSS